MALDLEMAPHSQMLLEQTCDEFDIVPLIQLWITNFLFLYNNCFIFPYRKKVHGENITAVIIVQQKP